MDFHQVDKIRVNLTERFRERQFEINQKKKK